jgi:hypothetical protein
LGCEKLFFEKKGWETDVEAYSTEFRAECESQIVEELERNYSGVN